MSLRKSLSQFVYYYTIAVGIFLRVTLISDFWLGGQRFFAGC